MKGGNGSHWDGCEVVHLDCCLAKLRIAEQSLAEAEEYRLKEMTRADKAEKARAHTIEVLNDCYTAMGDMQTRYDRLKAMLASTVDMVASARIQRNAAVLGLRAEIDACCSHARQVESCAVCECRESCDLYQSFRKAT